MNFGIYHERNARYFGDKPAVLFQGTSLSFRDLERRSNQLAHALQVLGLRKGDRVGIVSANRPEIIELECAFYKLGLVKVALNARLSPQELQDALINAEPVACIAAPDFVPVLDAMGNAISFIKERWVFGNGDAQRGTPWQSYEGKLAGQPDTHLHVPLASDDLAVLHYTSGSTGKLKAAMQTMGNRMTSMRKVAMGRFHARHDDVILLSGPITHASGMFIQAMLFQGTTIVLMEKFQAAAWLEAVEKHRITMAFLVPTMINALLAEPSIRTRDLSSLRMVNYGAAPMSATRIREAWQVLGPVLAQGYGAGETTGGIISLTTQDHARGIEGDKPELLASCGRAFCESEVQVLDDDNHPVAIGDIGEICVRGPDVYAGYWRAPEETAKALGEDGWLRTGDLARVDDEGYIYIVDRRKEMLVSGGFNVYPSEVEAVLGQHPAVYEVCVIGVPDDHWGEAVKAVVVLRDGVSADAAALIEFCRERLADFKKPRSVDFVDSLPKNSNGKLSRKEVRERYWAGRERKVN